MKALSIQGSAIPVSARQRVFVLDSEAPSDADGMNQLLAGHPVLVEKV